MTPSECRHERRAGQRFAFQLPVSVKSGSSGREVFGLTQDLSARGVFLYTELALAEGGELEITLTMPSEITLTESMRVRCRGRALRLAPARSGYKGGVAAIIEGYEFLPEIRPSAAETAALGPRISRVHDFGDRNEPVPAAFFRS